MARLRERTKFMYAVVSKYGHIDTSTLQDKKQVCISVFLSDSNMTWKEVKKYGWRCEKVEVNIRSTKNEW